MNSASRIVNDAPPRLSLGIATDLKPELVTWLAKSPRILAKKEVDFDLIGMCGVRLR